MFELSSRPERSTQLNGAPARFASVQPVGMPISFIGDERRNPARWQAASIGTRVSGSEWRQGAFQNFPDADLTKIEGEGGATNA